MRINNTAVAFKLQCCKIIQSYHLPFGQALARVYYTFQLAGKKILMSEQDWLQFFCNLNSPQNITCPSDKIHVHVRTEFKNFIAKSTTSGFWTRLVCTLLNSLSPNIRIQILQSDLYTFALRISWENLIKDQGIFSLVIIFINSHNLFSCQHMDIFRRKLMLITIGTWRVKD